MNFLLSVFDNYLNTVPEVLSAGKKHSEKVLTQIEVDQNGMNFYQMIWKHAYHNHSIRDYLTPDLPIDSPPI